MNPHSAPSFRNPPTTREIARPAARSRAVRPHRDRHPGKTVATRFFEKERLAAEFAAADSASWHFEDAYSSFHASIPKDWEIPCREVASLLPDTSPIEKQMFSFFGSDVFCSALKATSREP